LRTLFKRFWLTGFGWHYLSRAGIPLKRSLVDEFVYGAERVIFEGPPVVLSPLKQDQKARQPIVLGHEVIDSKAACPDLTQEEETEFAALVEADKKRLAPEISAARERYLAEETDALVKAKGLGEREARAIVEQRCSGVLATSDVLSWDDSRLAGITVADILHNPKKYAGKTLADPLEGVSYGTNKAKVVLRADGRPMITSFAHGKTNYWLKWDYVAIAAAIAAEEASKAVAALQAHLANPSHVVLTEEEREQLIKLTAERSGLDIEAVKEAVSGQTIPNASQRPCYRVFDEQVTSGLEKFRPGVWHFSIKPATSRTPEQRIDLWIATPIHILAVTHDDMDMNFGRCLRIRNANRRWRTWAMPMEMLAGDGTELRAELLAMGVEIDPHSKLLLASYLQSHHPERRMRCALHVGWHGQSFVLPDMVIGPGAPDIIFQSGELDLEDWGIGGTLEGWKTEVAALAVGNPLLQLSISTAFVGPLLARCFAEGGGLHFFGDSSIGKTTGVDAAASVWGGKDFKRSWRATANGLESIATLHNDCLLPLDEISECSSKEINAASYMLANGRLKQRASRTGSARSVKQWRCFVISSGEKTLATAMLEGDVHAKAGQAVRLLDVPCKRNFGFFDTLSGFANASAFSDTLRQSAKEHYGHAGRLFLEKLTHDGRDMGARLKLLKEAKAFNVGAEGQDKRVAARFAIVALAGELAIEYGVVPWPEGDAAKAALIGLETWQSQRPALGNAEPRQIIEQVSAFIDRHSDARFSHKESSVENVRDRAGWWDEDTDGNRSYLFTGAGLREATIRFDFSRVLDALQAAGALVLPNEVGRRVKSMRIGGRKVKVYEVLADKLGDA
jgi:putative DNA primase/helicase